MKRFNAFLVICLLTHSAISCSGTNNGSAGNNIALSDSSNITESAGNASFSCVIDGKAISGNGVDALQLRNTAFVYPDAKNGDRLLFNLYSTKDGNDTKADYAVQIRCPDKVGVYMKSGKNDHNNKCYIIVDFQTGDLSRYLEDSITVSIGSITSSRISGTFSGKLRLSNDTPRGIKKEIDIRDGKFDIPFSTGNLRPE